MLDAWHAGTGSKLWSFSAEGLISANIAVARGAVYFGSSDDHVYPVSAPIAGGIGRVLLGYSSAGCFPPGSDHR
jgi:hypothetical protein